MLIDGCIARILDYKYYSTLADSGAGCYRSFFSALVFFLSIYLDCGCYQKEVTAVMKLVVVNQLVNS
jgi:hypothetical protein